MLKEKKEDCCFLYADIHELAVIVMRQNQCDLRLIVCTDLPEMCKLMVIRNF